MPNKPFPAGPYAVIYADPPWRFKNWSMAELAKRGEKWARKNGRPPYPVLATEEICRFPVVRCSAKDSILFLWATYPKLQDALQVMQAWGFQYKTVAFTWVKMRRHCVPHFGLGYWTRANPEICLLGTRGHPKRISKCVPNLTMARLRGHSQKPDEVRDKIVALVGDLPRVELFARERAPGWDAWGEEIE